MKKIILLIAILCLGIIAMPQSAAAADPKCYDVTVEGGSQKTQEFNCTDSKRQGDIQVLLYGKPLEADKCYAFSAAGGAAVNCVNIARAVRGEPPLPEEEANSTVAATQQSLQEKLENPKTAFEQAKCTNTEECINNNPLTQMIIVGISILGSVVGVVVVIVIIIAGIQYASAGGNPNATSAAKKRILNAIIALVAYLFLFVILNWLLPGGLF